MKDVQQARCYAAPARGRPSGPKLRQDIDEKSRLGFYNLYKGQGILLVEPSIANAIYKDFVSHRSQGPLGDAVNCLATSK